MVAHGGHEWLLLGGVHGCSRGVCMVAWGGVHGCSWGGMHDCSGGGVWLLLGGMHGFSWGGMHGCSGGHAWLLPGGVCGCSRGHAWLLRGGVRGFFDEIRSMSGRYASYWNAFLFLKYIFEVESMATLSFVSFLAFGSLSLILSVRLSKPCYFEFVGHIA